MRVLLKICATKLQKKQLNKKIEILILVNCAQTKCLLCGSCFWFYGNAAKMKRRLRPTIFFRKRKQFNKCIRIDDYICNFGQNFIYFQLILLHRKPINQFQRKDLLSNYRIWSICSKKNIVFFPCKNVLFDILPN